MNKFWAYMNLQQNRDTTHKMIPNTIINDDFIAKWHPLYDKSDVGG